MNNSFFGNMPQQKGVAPQAAPSGTASMQNDIDPIKRAKFTGYLEGMSANTVPPQPPQPPMMPQGQGMGMPPMPPQGMQPPMMPQQPPMMMNMGGMVDVFDPMYMNDGGFVISTDDSGKIRTRPVFDEDKGRMVSQILSRDMVNEMANKAAMLKTRQSPPIEDEIAEFIGYADKPKSAIIDDSLKGVPDYTTTTIEPEESMISLPAPKPKIQMPVSKPKIFEGELPVSKPSVASMLRDIDDLGTEDRSIKDIDDLGTEDRMKTSDPFSYFDQEGPDQSLTFEKLMKPFVKPKLNVAKLIEGYDDPEESRDSAEYSNIIDDPQIADLILGSGDAVFDTPTLGNLSRNVSVGDAPDFSFSSDVPVEKLADLYKDNSLSAINQRKEEEGLGLLAKILNLLRPQFTTESAGFEEIGGDEEFPPSTALRSDRFNDGGIVQGFKPGGSVFRDSSFRSNISGNVSGLDDSDDDLRRDEDISFIDGKEIESTGPVYDAFLKSQESAFAPAVNKIGELMGKSLTIYTTQHNRL